MYKNEIHINRRNIPTSQVNLFLVAPLIILNLLGFCRKCKKTIVMFDYSL